MPPSEPKRWAVARLDEIPDDHPPGWWDHEAATPGFGKRWHSVRRHFGIEGFGIAASGADAGDELIVPHTELGGHPDAILFVPPHVHRAATASEDDTLVLGVGGAPGKAYRGLDPARYQPPPNPESVAARRATAQ